MKISDLSTSFKKINFDKIKNVIMLALPFLIMDFCVRIMANGVNYSLKTIILPNILFTAMWIGLIVALSLFLKGKAAQIFYGICFFVFFVVFFTHAVYYPYTGFFFSFNLLQSAQEGSVYILDTLKKTHFTTYLRALIVLCTGIFAIVKFPKPQKFLWKKFVLALLLFVIAHTLTPLLLGNANKSLEWDTWRNPRNVYENFSDSNKNIKICGIFEYTVRDFYANFLRSEDKEDPEELEFLKQSYSDKSPHAENQYTGIFEGKNVIFLQLEGIDTWLLNETDMPTLYSMKKNSIVFDNHYSYYTGGGSTFNSELAVTTGFITPISYTKNPYAFNTNYFPYSLANQLKKNGYRVNAFHMNSGEYYMRNLNYKNWGYDNYYSLMDDGDYKDASYQLDRELIENELFYNKMFKQKQPFMNYVISFTNHTPFSLDSKTAKLLTQKVYGDEDVPNMSEEEVSKFFASETDYMISLMLEALEENDLIDNTVIVAFADHYLYTINDKTVLDKYKTTDNNLINHTPFFIWSKDMGERHVAKVNSQLDILPTVLNLLGIEYNDNYYIGRDIFDNAYTGYVFFSDYSWYDGRNYVEYGTVEDEQNANMQYINETNTLINSLIRKNDLTLKYDYFRKNISKK